MPKENQQRRKRRYRLIRDSSNPHHYMARDIDWRLRDTKTGKEFYLLKADGWDDESAVKGSISPNGAQIIFKNGRGKVIKRIKLPPPAVIEFLDSVEAGDFDAVKAAVEKGIDINSSDYSGDRAIVYAVRNGHLKITRYLIDQGANIDVRVGRGIPLLQVAVTLGNYRIVRLLLDSGYDVNKKNYNKKTALFYAQKSDNQKIADLLIERGAEEIP